MEQPPSSSRMGPASSVPSSCAQKSIEIFGSNNNTEYFLSGEAPALKFVAHESLEKRGVSHVHESLDAAPGGNTRGRGTLAQAILQSTFSFMRQQPRKSLLTNHLFKGTMAYSSLRMSKQPMWVSVVIQSNAAMFRFDLFHQRHLDK